MRPASPPRVGWFARCQQRQPTDRFLSAHRSTDRTGVMRSERNRMNRRIKALSVLAVGAVALTAAGCGGGSTTNPPSSNTTLVVGVDLPFQGSSKDSSDDTFSAMKLYLESVGG